MDEEFFQSEAGVNAVDIKFDRMHVEKHGIRVELIEVKIAAAWLEGSRKRLVLPR